MSALTVFPAGVMVPEPLAGILANIDLTPGAGGGGAITAPTTIAALMGVVLPAGTPITHTVAQAPDVGLDVGFTTVTVDAPAGVRAATRVAGPTDPFPRAGYTPTGPLTFTMSGTLRVRVDDDVADADLVDVTITPSSRTILLLNGCGMQLPTRIAFVNGALDLSDIEVALPQGIPLLGGLVFPAALTPSNRGLDLSVPMVAGPSVSGAVEWKLDGPIDLTDLEPTGIDIAYTTPAAPSALFPGGPTANRSMVFRLSGSRRPGSADSFSATLSAEATGPNGLISAGPSAGVADKAAGVATVLAPAVLAGTGQAPSAALLAVLGGAVPLAEKMKRGGFTVHGITVDGSTRSSEAGPSAGLAVDVSGAIVAPDLIAGPIGIRTDVNRPLRVRWRNIRCLVAPDGTPTVNVDDARPEVVDAGGWRVQSPGNILEIVGTRSGSGSTWIEVDLRFAIDLGPLKVSGATIRATFDAGGVDIGVRGLTASINLPGLLSGTGQVMLDTASADQGMRLTVAATVVPLQLGALVDFGTRSDGTTRQVRLGVAVDLPGPIPLGPTGLGLYGAYGGLGINASMPPLGDDPMTSLREWKPWSDLDIRSGQITLGVGVIVGTAVDGGFVMSARGVLGMTAPDLAVRIGLDGKVMGDRYRFAEIESIPAGDDPPGLSFFGGLAASSAGLDIALRGRYELAPLIDVTVPVAAHFPFDDPRQWWFRAGSDDGVNGTHPPVPRPPGPIKAEVFAGTPFGATGWAFLMVEGAGLTTLLGRPVTTAGFTVAVGAGFSKVFGVEGILWAKVSASVAAAIAADPLMFWAQGRVTGELGIGPFSIGIDATVTLDVGPGDRVGYDLQVCGEIDLWLDTIRKCIRITNNAAAADVPEPAIDEWPFPELRLADGLGRTLSTPADVSAGRIVKDAPLRRTGADIGEADWRTTPTVWPDTIPLLTFPVAPLCDPPPNGDPSLNATGVQNTGEVTSGRITYVWKLESVSVTRVAGDGPTLDALKCAWQRPEGVPHGTAAIATNRQLALLSTHTGHSAAHWKDTGGPAPIGGPPSDYVGGLCGWRPRVGRGWAFGENARPAGTRRWYVPRESDHVVAARTVDSFSAGTGFTVTSARGGDLVGVGLAAPEGPAAMTEISIEDRRISGMLGLTGVGWYPLQTPVRSFFTHTVTFDEPADEGDLYLFVPKRPDDAERIMLRSLHCQIVRVSGPAESVVAEQISDDPVVLRVPVRADGANPATGIVITCGAAIPVGIVGLYALTASDRAKGAAGASGAVAGSQAQAAGTRQVLSSNSRYRIAVTMSWKRIIKQDGKSDVVTSSPVPQTRYWHFRTAVETGGGGAGVGGAGGAAGPGGSSPAPWKKMMLPATPLARLTAVDRFDPQYLSRYLHGYSPGDRARFMFLDDQPSATFGASHIADLLAAYGRRMALYLKRTDRDDDPEFLTILPVVLFAPLTPLDEKVAEAAGDAQCGVPPTGIRLPWPRRLAGNADYEMSVAFPRVDEVGHAEPLTDRTPQLDGITFTTSSYDNPTRLLEAFGFVDPTIVGAVGGLRGDLRVDLPAELTTPGLRRGDALVERAFADLGLPPPAPVDSCVSAVLWATVGEVWRVVGVLLQSAEPLVRPGRMSITGARIGSANATAGYVNDSGTVVLWLKAPTGVGNPTRIDILATDRDIPFVRRTRVASTPRFAAGALTARSR